MLQRSRYAILALSIGLWTLSGCVASSGSGGSTAPAAQGDGSGTGSGGNDGASGGQTGDGGDSDAGAGDGDTGTNGSDTTTDGGDTSTNGDDVPTDGGNQDTGTNGPDDGSGSAAPGVSLFVDDISPSTGQTIFLTCLVTEPTESPATSFDFFSTAGGGEIIQNGSASASAIIPPGLFTINYQCQAQSPAGPGPLSPVVIVNVGG